MELKWLEDLEALARIGHFARTAETRLITQSALSRRIQALEGWVGVQLVDRTKHPIALTTAGREFLDASRKIVDWAYDAQERAGSSARMSKDSITIGSMHTLSLYFLPRLIASLTQSVGRLSSSIETVPRNIDEYLYNLRTGVSDFYVGYLHPNINFDVDPDQYPRLLIGTDRLVPCASDPAMFERLSDSCDEPIPYLAFHPSSITHKIVKGCLDRAPFGKRLDIVYRATLAEALSAAATLDLGIAWLPESLLMGPGAASALHVHDGPWCEPLDIIIVRSRANERPIVNRIWAELEENYATGHRAADG
ncbi:LysR family transcriptional regulator [Pelagerythrobacter marinus]|uniref:LysR family transcriptional regulator n=1 Tax=Pelagerythrobacter marinus TaxID=538382 RepID=A0ABW9UZZ1_9SPHN|nr:LysR family transcriptional regulator [Pelagerythrobacter marinus]MXO69402.1 LysR family transcriptional regulator [Pelagerythrobacter marinus]USA39511.1 LysR family transcriptional regulator [Pelagerythrobacter marinus]WPZ06349.1 LysR family transcriptional regulator [Pelagerythrobacter marinus]